jgi:hypothetical protein
VQLYRSSDAGATWSGPAVLADGVIDDRDAGVIETRKGTLLVNWFTSTAWDQRAVQLSYDATEPWQTELGRLSREYGQGVDEESRRREIGVWLVRSEDGGRTWQPRVATGVASPHGPTELADGRLLFVGVRLWDNNQVAALESTDDGRTWRAIGGVPTAPGDRFDGYREPHAVQAADGRIVCHLRNHNEANGQYHETLQTESADGGRTWTRPHSIGVWGFPSHLYRLPDGRLLMSYSHRREPRSCYLRVSADHGQTWSAPTTAMTSPTVKDFGYPTSVALPDGRLVTVWYQADGTPHTHLRCALWRWA